jgi:phage terminase small subunit
MRRFFFWPSGRPTDGDKIPQGGYLSHDRNSREIEPKMSRANWLTRPAGLSTQAAEIWKYYASGLSQAGLLTQESAESFRFLCEILAAARAAAGEIERFGVTIATSTGGRKPNPAVAQLFTAQKQAEPLLAAFGLSARE